MELMPACVVYVDSGYRLDLCTLRSKARLSESCHLLPNAIPNSALKDKAVMAREEMGRAHVPSRNGKPNGKPKLGPAQPQADTR